MIATQEILLSILGVAFHEAVRVYRCLTSGRPILPSAGFSSGSNLIIYATVLIVFGLTATFCAHFAANGNPYGAFIFGTTIPTGARLLTPVTDKGENTKIDDMWSEERPPRFRDRKALWVESYFV